MKTQNDLIAIKYSKKRLYDDVYVFSAKSVVEGVELNEDGSITYVKNGNRKKLNSIINPYFLVSDEKAGFGDVYSLSTLCSIYKISNREEMFEVFKKAMERVIRIGILDEKNDCVRIASVIKDAILNVPYGEEAFKDFIVEKHSYADRFMLDKNALNVLIKNLEENKNDIALSELRCIKKIVEEYSKNNQSEGLTVDLEDTPEVVKIDYENLMNSLVGLEDVKKMVKKLKNNLIYLKKTKDMVKLEKLNLNMVFTGNPGTGKTTIAKIIAGILYDLGYVANPDFADITAKDLIAGYVGQTSIKTRQLIDEHKGAVIFVDEAYVLASKSEEFAEEALSEILKEMEKRETVFIFAGYEKEMLDFVKMNSGLTSRFGTHLDFKDYSLEELTEIFDRKLKKSLLKITPKTRECVIEMINDGMKKENFGNGRFVDQLFDKILLNHGNNTYKSNNKTTLTTLHLEDLEGVSDELKDKVKVKTIGFKN